ncbi:MAG: PaaI family thioesterase [Hyphomonadaceae bacterium]|nr:PaaI family thioesterase [Hyphomonadaceae bacterium]
MSAPAAPVDEAALRARLAAVPFARFFGVDLELRGDELTLVLPYRDALVGNPVLPALHGGVVGALLEFAAVMTVGLRLGQAQLPKTIDINIDYLRSGRPTATFARAIVTRQGRRIASVSAEAWQFERADPIAALHGHFLLTPE